MKVLAVTLNDICPLNSSNFSAVLMRWKISRWYT